MKKNICVIVAVLQTIISALASEQALYVYRNDGSVNAFYVYEIDSICYSQYDIDSVWHNSCQVQEVYTEDSIYRIPISIIDSVSFITPKTKYKTGVVNISENLMDYIIRCDSMTIILKAETPVELIPEVGTRLVTLEMNDFFPLGFAGEVNSVSTTDEGRILACTSVTLQDVFDTYYGLSSVYGYHSEKENAIKLIQAKQKKAMDHTGNLDFEIGTISWDAAAVGFSLASEVSPTTDKGNLAVSVNSSLSFSTTPTVHIRTFLQVNKGETYFSYNINGTVVNEQSLSIGGQISYSRDFPLLPKFVAGTNVAPFVRFYYEPGIYLKLDATASITSTTRQEYTFMCAGDMSNKGNSILKPHKSFKETRHTAESSGSLSGSLGFGGYFECGLSVFDLGFDLSEDFETTAAKMAFRAELGAEVTGNFVLYEDDIETAQTSPSVYERGKDATVELNIVGGLSVVYKLLALEGSINTPLNLKYKFKEWDIFPTFEKVSFIETNENTAIAKYTAVDNCLVPMKIGMSIRGEDNIEVTQYNESNTYRIGPRPVSHTFSGLVSGKKYTLYPQIQWLGVDLLASPSCPLNEKKWVVMSNFDIVDSAYSKTKEFVYKGTPYAYKYDCAIKLELDTAGTNMQVMDWGYAYVDLQEDTTYISLSGLSNPYMDNRYTYYRNKEDDSLKLIGYVKFNDVETIILETPSIYELYYDHYCMDNQHQHMVDLGLVSGTLWACMNMGATKPEDVGDRYAWGETTPKTNFTQYSYLYYVQNGDYPYYDVIGGNISGTMYDAAYLKWGDGWRLPTQTEIKELMDSCTWEWTTKKSVVGYKVTGPNGNSIFLPYAPVMTGQKLGTVAHYQSSFMSSAMFDNAGPGIATIAFKQNEPPYLGCAFRYMGTVIRPVKTKP